MARKAEKPAPAPATPAPKQRRRARTPLGASLEQIYTTRKQAAIMLGISVQAVALKIRDKEIPEYRFGPFCSRILIADLMDYANKCLNGSSPNKPKAINASGHELLC